ncbi:SDR family NAD(P)-dependent oxidoreductase [Paenibacillus allorhizosphaerae]|uniref:3-oxoacyl-[acyl-carrier-protein] reductase FabG n=1 Tax=Paenibacillus allorhizosphaerae TaxID=2849866 RepID=A0ABM8VDF9_9BACL|nr:SDR family oxidoreductase [Paenibacillus allorhizosphaerae]CAG7625380.1 3-oxoacyl-[acyl-carrier-protein] reductase FabG [Paenibacillus allorhizosphaerae]
MKIDLTNQVALVTGSSGGIGRAIAIELAACGAKVIVHYLSNREGAEETAGVIRQAGGDAVVIQADVTDLDQIEALVKQSEQAFGTGIDILVNNAGNLIERRTIEEMTLDLYRSIIDVNLTSAVFVTKAVIAGMKAKGGGAILNLSSLAAHNGGGPGSSIYAASKGAILTLTKSMAKELASYGIRANCLAPGFIEDTKFHSTFTSAEARKATIASIPLGRGGVPQDITGIAAFLVSSHSSFITGETIEINGGVFMR